MEICWNAYFSDEKDVTVVCSDLHDFLQRNQVECIVSPTNSYGLMDGDFDLAISSEFGWDLQTRVQKYIIEHYKGEQPIGSSFIIDIGINDMKLIHTPTMRIPFPVKDPMIVYQRMRTTLMVALENHIESIVIPAFCGEWGEVSPKVISRLMCEDYKQVMNPPVAISWDYAERWRPELQYVMERWKSNGIKCDEFSNNQ